MFTGACTKDEDCENATIETGIDNCASMPHYPQEELLGNSVEFTMENAATKESFEDETQLGNVQDNFERLGICGESSRFKDMRESFSLKKVTLRRRVMRRSLEEHGNLERCSSFSEPLVMNVLQSDRGKSKISNSSHRLTRYLRSCEISEFNNYDDNDNNYTNSDKGKDDNDDYSDIDND